MSLSSVESSLTLAQKDLAAVNSRREILIRESRDVISLCSKTIISLHTLNYDEARRLSREAKRKLIQLRKIARQDLVKHVSVPEQEYVEASVMLSIADDREIPSLQKFGVMPSSYLLGLLDSIGEMKRVVYDRIRRNDVTGAEARFKVMENLFVMLSPFAVYDNVVPGLRRKLDVARMLVEDTRSTITEESRRSEFMASISDLSSKLGARTKAPT